MNKFMCRIVLLFSCFAVAACSGTSPTGGGAGGEGGAGGTQNADAGGGGGTGGMACESTCMPGLVRCVGDAIETCADSDRDGCYEWSSPVACAEGFACSNGICTDPSACTDECTIGATQCGPMGIQLCAADFDSDPCGDWGPSEPCGEGESCSNGVCSAGPCQDECGEDARRCSGPGFQVCGQFDVDECLEWSQAIDCGDNLTCSNGECTSPDECTDECVGGIDQCVDGNLASAQCGQFDGDPCLELGEQTRCTAGEICSSGRCGPPENCDVECVAGERRCQANGFQLCRDLGDGCFVFGEPQPCDAGMGCVDGICIDGSVDECPGLDAIQCAGDGVQTCGQFDADPALEWSVVQDCPNGQTCSLGVCSADCVDECEDGVTTCRGGGTVTCGQHDSDACRDLGDYTPCAAGESCSVNTCAPLDQCRDECEIINATRCNEAGVQQCGNYDADDCLDWSAAIACGDGQVCDGGSCVVAPDPNNNDNATLDIFAPADGATLSGELAEIRINAVDPDGIDSLIVTIGGILVAQAAGDDLPGGWLTTRIDTRPLEDGLTTLRATLTDQGGRTLEATRAIRIDNNGPTIRITSPADGRILGGAFEFAANLTDVSGIQSYSFLVGLNNVGEDLNVADRPARLEQSLALNAADYEEGPVVLTVRATDVFGHQSEATVNVEFRSGLIVESISPAAAGGRFPDVARPFTWTVGAQAPAGVVSVEFQVDGQRVSVDNEAPYEAIIDPGLYVDSQSVCPRGQHELIAIVTDANQQIARGTWCATWDDESPEISLIAPDEPGSLLARDGESYIIEVAVDDADTAPTVAISFDGQEVGRAIEPPYAISVDAGALLNGLETHDQEVSVEVTATDYLGNADQLLLPVRLTRGDWAISTLTYVGRLAHRVGDNALMGMWSGIRQQGRLIMLGAAGSGGALWDLNIRRGWQPADAITYPGSTAVGVRCDLPATGASRFLRVDPDGRVWEFLDGYVTKAVPGNGLFTYLHVAPSSLLGIQTNGQTAFEIDFSNDLPAQNIQSISALGNGEVLVHTIGAQDALLNRLHRINSAGEIVWTYDVGGAITQNHIDIMGETMIFARTIIDGGDTVPVLTRIDFGTGLLLWEWAAPRILNKESSKFNANGFLLWRASNLHSFRTHLFAIDPAIGEQVYTRPPAADAEMGFSPPGYDMSTVLNLLPAGDTVVHARTSSEVEPGLRVASLYRVGNDGRIGALYTSEPAVQRGNTLIAPDFQTIASAGGNVAVAIQTAATGQGEVAMLNSDLQELWRLGLPDGAQVNRLLMSGPEAIDVTTTSADEGDSVFPISVENGAGSYPWRIHSPQATLGGFIGTATTLFVMLNNDDGVDVIRIERE
ncbi:MAG: hypothetical protein VYA30_09545 [Myxococcota bacterium]|nr:hypothetical protein [Myxococcota bacterium]